MSEPDYTEMQRHGASSDRPCQRCMQLGSECGFCRIKRESAEKAREEAERLWQAVREL